MEENGVSFSYRGRAANDPGFVASENHLLCSQTLWARGGKAWRGWLVSAALSGVQLGRSQGRERLGWGLDSS